jgi:ornithine decarboxylase
LLRISFPNEVAEIKLFEKFGVEFEQAKRLLNKSNSLEINTVGISFHVGSRMRASTEYIKAIEKSAQLFVWSEIHLNHRMDILDIGGGFPCFESKSEESSLSFFEPIKSALNEYFPQTKIIAEPGRCISNSCIGIATTVIGKSVKNGTHWYYLDDGIYGSFSGICFDNRALEIEVINKNRKGKFNSVLTGPTCDSFDTLTKNIPLPNLEINDILYSPNMGAYTLATCTQFNSIHEATLICVDNTEQEEVSTKNLELCL